jgi:hypothetical protein
MGFFSSSSNKKGITPAEFVRHGLYRKFRAVFQYGPQGVKKYNAFNAALDIREDSKHLHPPRLMRPPITEDNLEEKLKRLIDSKIITPKEADEIREIANDDLIN